MERAESREEQVRKTIAALHGLLEFPATSIDSAAHVRALLRILNRELAEAEEDSLGAKTG